MTDQESNILLEALNEGLRSQGEIVLTLTAPIKTPVLQGDRYKTYSLKGDEEFILDKVRVGARKQVIFVVKPMDSRDYQAAEFDEKIVFRAFPELETVVTGWLGGETTVWSREKKRFVAEKLAELEAEREITESGKYADNPAWGSF